MDLWICVNRSRSLSCAFNIPLLSSALDNMDTFYAYNEFRRSCWEKTGFGSNSFAPHCCPSKTAERVWVPGQDEEISCSPALTVSLSCVFTWCVASSCHCSPGHFWVCVHVLCYQGWNNYWNCIRSYSSAVTAKPSSRTQEAYRCSTSNFCFSSSVLVSVKSVFIKSTADQY